MRFVRSAKWCWLTVACGAWAAVATMSCGGGGGATDAGIPAGDANTDANTKDGTSGGGKEGGSTGGGEAGADGPGAVDASSAEASSDAGGGSTNDAPMADVAIDAPAPSNDLPANATPITIGSTPVDIAATTLGAKHDVDAPCASNAGADVFYAFTFSKRVLVYADTFGANWDTVLYFLTSDGTPVSTTTTGDAVCNDGACGTQQSQIVALFEPGKYLLGLSGRGNAEGTATIHFQWAIAGSGTITPLPKGTSVQSGTTSGSGNISCGGNCIGAGPENSYWWTDCPTDTGGTLSASTCDGGVVGWDPVLEVQIPAASSPLTCACESCGLLQVATSATIPTGSGLRMLSIDGEDGNDKGAYMVSVDRP